MLSLSTRRRKESVLQPSDTLKTNKRKDESSRQDGKKRRTEDPKEEESFYQAPVLVPRNLVHQLWRRSTTGRSRGLTVNATEWRQPSWIRVPRQVVDAMVWTTDGLAVATQRQIQLYCLDSMRAADVQGRSARVRRLNTCRQLTPTTALSSLPATVAVLHWESSLRWLAVGFRSFRPTVRIYDTTIAPATYNDITVPSNRAPRTTACSALLWLPQKHLLVAFQSTLACWKFKNEGPRLVWIYPAKFSISALTADKTGSVVLGSTQGHVAVVDWNRFTRKAFSTHVQPTVRSMGRIVTDGIVHLQRAHSNQLWIVTRGGWLWSLQKTKKLHWKPLQVTCRNSRDELIDLNETSAPLEGTVAAHGRDNVVVWRYVEAVTQVLPSHDRHVLSQTQTLREDVTALLWFDVETEILQTVALPRRGTPILVQLEPRGEWMAVATRDNWYLLHNRPRLRMDRSNRVATEDLL